VIFYEEIEARGATQLFGIHGGTKWAECRIQLVLRAAEIMTLFGAGINL